MQYLRRIAKEGNKFRKSQSRKFCCLGKFVRLADLPQMLQFAYPNLFAISEFAIFGIQFIVRDLKLPQIRKSSLQKYRLKML
jgi:hypothetical protein